MVTPDICLRPLRLYVSPLVLSSRTLFFLSLFMGRCPFVFYHSLLLFRELPAPFFMIP